VQSGRPSVRSGSDNKPSVLAVRRRGMLIPYFSPIDPLSSSPSCFQICEQSRQKHAEHDHFHQRKWHKHHLRSGGDTSPPKFVVPPDYFTGKQGCGIEVGENYSGIKLTEQVECDSIGLI